MGMVLFARKVVDPVLIAEVLKMMDTVYVGVNDEDGYPYVVPLNFGFEMEADQLKIYAHFPRRGKKCELFERDPRVCCTFSAFNDFPDRKWKGFCHDGISDPPSPRHRAARMDRPRRRVRLYRELRPWQRLPLRAPPPLRPQ